MRAREPDIEGYVERRGVKVGYEVFGDGDPTILLLPTWAIVHSRSWKAQVPFLARRYRVITYDPRGNGRSDRPDSAEAYSSSETIEDAVAVLDATGTDAAIVVGLSMGGGHLLGLAARHPERVLGAVFVAAALGLEDSDSSRPAVPFEEELDTDEGWAKFNMPYWRRDWPGFVDFFMERMLPEPHSTKQFEDMVGWGLETDPETIIKTKQAAYLELDGVVEPGTDNRAPAYVLADRITCPSLVVHGTRDRIIDLQCSERLAEALGCELVTFEGSGHVPNGRDPVPFNLLLRDFIDRVCPPAKPEPKRWVRAQSRSPRALYLSSPIGLGHALRDVSIAAELRKQRPDLQIDWLAQDPVTRVLTERGENIHPASRWLASESAHVASESAEHDLHCFQAYRRMDEILLANFHVLQDVVEEGPYDLVIGDEAWDLDYFWHENPELKRQAFAWLTDFVGWLPMPVGGDREIALTADYNAEMIEQIERSPRVRDRAIFVGTADDIVPDRFGPGLPSIREWTEEHYDFSGYITGFDPITGEDRVELRERLGYLADERCASSRSVAPVSARHSCVASSRLSPLLPRPFPRLRMVVVTGPRIDAGAFPTQPGLEIRPYVPSLYQHLAACDVAVVQGGLTTTMELTANQRPFLYFPLRNHFEQVHHVRHRLDRYGAGRCMDYTSTNPEVLADAIREELGRPIRYRPVETDGASRAASRIASLI